MPYQKEFKEYSFREFRIRPSMLDAIDRYINDRILPGNFLRAIISNDLRESTGRADDDNLRNIPAFVAFFWNEAPASCWGSTEKMKAWIENKKERR